MQRVLVITDAMTQPLYTPRVRYLCATLQDRGVEVDLVAEKYETVPYVFPYRYREVEYYKGGKLDWVVKNIANLICDYKNRYFSRSVIEMCGDTRYDVVVCSTFHNLGMRAARDIAKRMGVPMHVDLRDIAEQTDANEYSNSLARRYALLGRYYRWLNINRRNKILAEADSISTVSKWHVDFLKKDNENVHLVYNGYDDKLFYPQHEETDTFDIVYAGKWYGEKMQDPSFLFAALRNIAKTKKDIRLKWYTNESVHDDLRKLAKENVVDDISEVHSYVANEEVPRLLNSSSMILVLTNKGARGILTTKFFEAIGVGKPVICVRSDEGSLEELIRETGAGYSCRSVDETEQAILECYEQWKTKGMSEVEVRDREEYTRERQTDKLIKTLDSLTNR